MLKETHGRCDSIALTKELLIAVRRLCHRRLALSVTFGATSPKGRALKSIKEQSYEIRPHLPHL